MAKRVRICFVWTLSITAVLAACSIPNTQSVSEPYNNAVKVFFTPGTDCENAIVERIKQSNKMDIAIYSITSPAITNAIIIAHNNGAAIRIVTDKTQAKGKKSSVPLLRSAGIPVRTNKKTKIEHNKFIVFDDVYVESGSFNYTTNAVSYNSENCIFFDQPEGMEYSKRFEYLWKLYE